MWSARAREAVPHLTEQTTEVRGFQILIEAFRLWTIFVNREPHPPERLMQFFMLVEQAFARTVGCRDGDWSLPGARRVRSRLGEIPRISVADAGWHLLGGQLTNGIWGLYRGAARRAGLLDANMAWLSDDTWETACATSCLRDVALERLFGLIRRAMDGETVDLPTDGRNALPSALRTTFDEVPFRSHLRQRLIEGHDLNRALANRLVPLEQLDHRRFFELAASELGEHSPVLSRVIDCENLLAVLEGVFYRLCCARGDSLDALEDDLPVHLERSRRPGKRLRVRANTRDRRQGTERSGCTIPSTHPASPSSHAPCCRYTRRYAKNVNALPGCGKSKEHCGATSMLPSRMKPT